MRRMDRETDPLRPAGLLASWLTAAWAFPAALVLAAIGQGIGAVLGGCAWIGVSLPVDRPVWALVNQPVLSFAASASAGGYWLGSLLLPAAIAGFTLGFVPRPRTFSAEMAAVQLVWASVVVPLAWLPMLDLEDGHLARWLHFRELPEYLMAVAPAVAAALAILPALRLLAIERAARRHLGRGLRLLTVLVHLAIPAAVWVAGSTVVTGDLRLVPLVAAAAPMVAALTVAWLGYPGALTRRLAPLSFGAVVRGVLLVALLAALLWIAGRPLSAGRCSGILWGTPTSMNNLRSWIEPLTVKDLAPARPVESP